MFRRLFDISFPTMKGGKGQLRLVKNLKLPGCSDFPCLKFPASFIKIPLWVKKKYPENVATLNILQKIPCEFKNPRQPGCQDTGLFWKPVARGRNFWARPLTFFVRPPTYCKTTFPGFFSSTPSWTSRTRTRWSPSSIWWKYIFCHDVHHFSLVFDGKSI